MEIQSNISLKQFNTFHVECKAKYFVELHSEEEIHQLIGAGILKTEKILILGGGSNMLFTKDFDGLVLHPVMKGIAMADEEDHHIILDVKAGENWADLVAYCVERGWSGLENLAAIPGSAGAAPVQNIGAYGLELKDVFVSLKAVDLLNGQTIHFNKNDCEFEYRNSVFKTKYKNKYLISEVRLQLSKKDKPIITYEALSRALIEANLEPSLKNIYESVCKIRASKLPDPKEIGNAGSFFKNPTIDQKTFESLKKLYPDVKYFNQHDGTIKLAAGWLIESCGWKGKQMGEVGVHPKQALVLVNYGESNGRKILILAELIRENVFEKFGVILQNEVNIL